MLTTIAFLNEIYLCIEPYFFKPSNSFDQDLNLDLSKPSKRIRAKY